MRIITILSTFWFRNTMLYPALKWATSFPLGLASERISKLASSGKFWGHLFFSILLRNFVITKHLVPGTICLNWWSIRKNEKRIFHTWAIIYKTNLLISKVFDQPATEAFYNVNSYGIPPVNKYGINRWTSQGNNTGLKNKRNII